SQWSHGNNVDDNRRTLTTSSVEVGSNSTTELELNEVVRSMPRVTSIPITSSNSSCDFCYRFHVNNHHHLQQSSRSGGGGGPIRRVSPHHSSRPYYYDHHHQPQYYQPYAPYPPQWYYLLGADSKAFRKHKHSHYHKDCKVCRQIVKQTFEQYYLGANSSGSMAVPGSSRVDGGGGGGGGTESPDSVVPMSLLSDHHSDPLLMDSAATPSPLPLVFLPRRRASCGHSCLKYSILFYCSAAVILAICFICYLTRIFGYLEAMPGVQFSSNGTPVVTEGVNLSEMEMLPTSVPMLLNGNNETTVKSELLNIVSTTLSTVMTTESPTEPFFSAATTTSPNTPGLLESLVRTEVIGLIVSSALMIIFFLGMVGAFLESVLALYESSAPSSPTSFSSPLERPSTR
ncbi:hypothetical protein TYRP_003760, partial [Tyrophagus putrescentiae]